MALPIRRAIPEIEGIQDQKVAVILRAMKAVIEDTTGKNPRKSAIKSISPNSVPDGIWNKINEIIDQLQDTTTSQAREPSTQPTVDSIWFYDYSSGKMRWLTLAGGSLQITDTTLDTLNGSACLRGPGTAS